MMNSRSESKDTILFRQSFPKQPMTRQFNVVFYIDNEKSVNDHGRFVVHNEYLSELGYFREGGSYLNSYEDGLKEYQARCDRHMEWYRVPGIWGRIQDELLREANQ